MKERKMQFSCYSKEKSLSYSCSFISSLPLKGKKEVLWIQQQLWASNVHTENGMLTLVANGTVTTWSVSRIRRPPLAVMLAMSTPLGQTTHRTNSSFIISLSFNLFDNDYIRWWCVVACCSQALFFNLFEFKGDLLAWTFEERYCQSTKVPFLYSTLKTALWTFCSDRVVKGANINNPAAPPFFFGRGGGGHHLFSCQDELMFTRNKKKNKTSQSVFLPEWEMMQPRHPSAGVAARCYMMPPDPLTFENGLLRPVVLRHDGGLHVGRTLYASVLWVWSQPLLLWFVCFGAGSVP